MNTKSLLWNFCPLHQGNSVLKLNLLNPYKKPSSKVAHSSTKMCKEVATSTSVTPCDKPLIESKKKKTGEKEDYYRELFSFFKFFSASQCYHWKVPSVKNRFSFVARNGRNKRTLIVLEHDKKDIEDTLKMTGTKNNLIKLLGKPVV